MPHPVKGTRTPGSGKRKGHKAPQTLSKELARELVRARVVEALEPMLAAQIAHAQGVKYMVLRKPDGSFVRATDEKQVAAAIAAGGLAFEIYTQAPNVQAFTDLLNRALDKPKEQDQAIVISGEIDLIAKLLVGRQRAAANRGEPR